MTEVLQAEPYPCMNRHISIAVLSEFTLSSSHPGYRAVLTIAPLWNLVCVYLGTYIFGNLSISRLIVSERSILENGLIWIKLIFYGLVSDLGYPNLAILMLTSVVFLAYRGSISSTFAWPFNGAFKVYSEIKILLSYHLSFRLTSRRLSKSEH